MRTISLILILVVVYAAIGLEDTRSKPDGSSPWADERRHLSLTNNNNTNTAATRRTITEDVFNGKDIVVVNNVLVHDGRRTITREVPLDSERPRIRGLPQPQQQGAAQAGPQQTQQNEIGNPENVQFVPIDILFDDILDPTIVLCKVDFNPFFSSPHRSVGQSVSVASCAYVLNRTAH
jgi:hypothetical protein